MGRGIRWEVKDVVENAVGCVCCTGERLMVDG